MKGLGNTDLGQISRHIVDIYTRLRKAKDDLFREREKLITHLQISNEGLAIFNPGKDVVLANGLFMQYVNLISDKNIGGIEEVFQVKELQPLFDFITMSRKSFTQGDLRQKLLVVDKNGYVFNLSVALFVDNSFEISISDITKQEEQARMKQQITQNIAHELKTPVSSIQGYLETILNNPAEIKLAVSRPADKIIQAAYVCYENQKLGIIRSLFTDEVPERVIIFASSKIKVKEVTKALKMTSDWLSTLMYPMTARIMCTVSDVQHVPTMTEWHLPLSARKNRATSNPSRTFLKKKYIKFPFPPN